MTSDINLYMDPAASLDIKSCTNGNQQFRHKRPEKVMKARPLHDLGFKTQVDHLYYVDFEGCQPRGGE